MFEHALVALDFSRVAEAATSAALAASSPVLPVPEA
jgi:hypothetical protein